MKQNVYQFTDLFECETAKAGSWCETKINEKGQQLNTLLETIDKDVLELAIYKEPTGELTLQIFKNDEVILCEMLSDEVI